MGNRSIEHWSSRIAFILATIGGAIGLGNIWRFPYVLGTSGGSAFVIVYIAALLLIAAPAFMAETLIGRLGQGSPPKSLGALSATTRHSPKWVTFGWSSILTSLLIFSFYSVIAGWSLAYLYMALTGKMFASSATPQTLFNDLQSNVGALTLWHSLFAGITAFIVSNGVNKGIERAISLMLPLLVAILIGLAIYSSTTGRVGEAVQFLFSPNFSALTPQIIMLAVSQAFFTIGIGMGAVMVYGAYLGKNINLFRATGVIVLADTSVALLAGFVIFPIVFAQGLNPAEGPGLVFLTLPIAFKAIVGGRIVAIAFFALLSLAALTSAVALLSPLAEVLKEKGISRRLSAWGFTAFAWVLGFATILSFNKLSGFYPLSAIGFFRDLTMYQIIEFVSAILLLLINGAAFAVFGGWMLKKEQQITGLGTSKGIHFSIWRFSVRFIAPTFILIVLISNLIN